jgi:predicted Ser/Thr protein kinase
MSPKPACPRCGARLPEDAPAGLCPKCLLQAGFESQPGLRSTAAMHSGFVPPSVEELAAHFPQLEMLEFLGKGGMGAVYKARQPGLDRLVAVKILPLEVGAAAAFTERFTREARALARLSHPNIVAIYDFGQTADGLFYFVMEYVDGVNLRQMIQAGKMTPQEALAIVPRICDALQFAHDEGVVHRDIKPENILVDKKSRIKIADFGLAKLLGQEPADQQLTGSQQVMGTPRYMAPEQLVGSHDVDHRADIYSLGVVFYELLTGELPLGRFAPPSKKVMVDVRLDEVVLRALEREPEQRYQHASEVRTAIEQMSPAGLVPPRPPVERQSANQPPVNQPTGEQLIVDREDLFPRHVAIALGGLIGGLSAAAGVALVAFAILSDSPHGGQFWGWIVGSSACFLAGAGALVGALSAAQQPDGLGEMISAVGWNWLDRVLGCYALLGVLVIVSALLWGALENATRCSVLVLGVLVVAQTVIYGMLRSSSRRRAAKTSG